MRNRYHSCYRSKIAAELTALFLALFYDNTYVHGDYLAMLVIVNLTALILQILLMVLRPSSLDIRIQQASSSLFRPQNLLVRQLARPCSHTHHAHRVGIFTLVYFSRMSITSSTMPSRVYVSASTPPSLSSVSSFASRTSRSTRTSSFFGPLCQTSIRAIPNCVIECPRLTMVKAKSSRFRLSAVGMS